MRIDMAETANRHDGRPAETIDCRATVGREDKEWRCEAAVSGRRQPEFYTDELELDGKSHTSGSVIKNAYFHADNCVAVGAERRDDRLNNRKREENDMESGEVHWSDEYDVGKVSCGGGR
jgi:hypothetical protein